MLQTSDALSDEARNAPAWPLDRLARTHNLRRGRRGIRGSKSKSGVLMANFGFIVTALICSALVHHVDDPLLFALRVGLVTGIVTGLFQMVNPFIEYFADNPPERTLGVFGVGLMLCGFALQSLQYWLVLFDVHVS
jgi:hypothetical protein